MESESDVLKDMVIQQKNEIGILKDSTLVGEKQREIDILQKKLQSR